MKDGAWIREFPAAITVCDAEGVLLAMNDRARVVFADDGGESLIGTNMLDCHPEPARTKAATLLKSGVPNVYIIEKAGITKLIFQSPWYKDGAFAGFVELSLPIPGEIPHFIRGARQSR